MTRIQSNSTSRHAVFVTGGASGIGLSVVEAVLAQGWFAIVADNNTAGLDRVAERFGKAVHCCPLDISSEAEVINTVGACERDWGPISGVVNSAGIGKDVSAFDTGVELFNKTLSINLVGSFLVAREAAKMMRTRKGGSIVNIASVSGMRGNGGRTAYGASKGGVIAMTQVLALEWAPLGIRANVVAPGPVDTPLAQEVHTEATRSAWLTAVPLKRYGTPAEIAAAVVFLLDDASSSYITGQTLCIDGGFTTAGIAGHS